MGSRHARRKGARWQDAPSVMHEGRGIGLVVRAEALDERRARRVDAVDLHDPAALAGLQHDLVEGAHGEMSQKCASPTSITRRSTGSSTSIASEKVEARGEEDLSRHPVGSGLAIGRQDRLDSAEACHLAREEHAESSTPTSTPMARSRVATTTATVASITTEEGSGLVRRRARERHEKVFTDTMINTAVSPATGTTASRPWKATRRIKHRHPPRRSRAADVRRTRR